MRDLLYRSLLSIAVADGATSPDPGFQCFAWSSTLGAPVYWNGTIWRALVRNLKEISVASGGLTTASTSYTAGDQLGSQFTLANAALASGGAGVITGVALIDAADVIGSVDVVIFASSVTLASDNAAFSLSDTDAKEIIAIIPLVGAWDVGNNRVALANGVAIPYVCNGGTSLFAGLITRSAHTFFGATTDLQLKVYVERYS